MNGMEILEIKNEETKRTSKQELAEICKVDVRTITNIIGSLNKESSFPIQNHTKKGGYHNSEVFYDEELVISLV